MIYAQVADSDREPFEKELKETSDAKWYRRLLIIDLSSKGKTVVQLAEMFSLNPVTVRDYLHRYNTGGIFQLRRDYSTGRPKKIDLTKREWEELLHRSPSQFALLNTAARNWTQEMLVDYCKKYLGVSITQGRLAQIFKKLGIKWNRGKLKVTSPDPLYTVKRERIETLKKKVNWAS